MKEAIEAIEVRRQTKLGAIAAARKCIEANLKMNEGKLKEIVDAEAEVASLDLALARLRED